ncbi:type III effector HopM1 [Pseudomonas sp. GL-B-16]|uniref:type III effector HopM1 n=1 Tax=Pseudomonas sp. GL-B-16 TaxID=2832373 RepID=UPI001CBCF1C2|nr:type III effector HopM1 [Pseudomonas sp. GL-B-16]
MQSIDTSIQRTLGTWALNPIPEEPNSRPQARPSSRPPQALQRPPNNQMYLFEMKHPAFRAVRAEVRGMIVAQRPLNFSRPIHPLAREANRRTQNALEMNKKLMILEGRVLEMDSALNYESLSALLCAGQPGQLKQYVPYGDTLERLLNDIDQHFSKPLAASQDVSGKQLRGLLDQALLRIAKHLDGQAALYEEVLSSTDLSTRERDYVKAGRDVFQAMGARWSTDIEGKLNECLSLVEDHLQHACNELPLLTANSEQTVHIRQDQQSRIEQLRLIQTQFSEAVRDLKSGPLQDSLDNMGLDQHLQRLSEQNSGLFTSARIFLGAGIPQGVASMLQFVLARAYVEPRLSRLSLAKQSATSGAAVGAVHETLDNFLKPAVREVLVSLGASELRKVDAKEAIASPPLATTEGGRYREFTPEQLHASQEAVAQARKGFINAQQDYYNGTLKGDNITFGAQGGAQMMWRVIELIATLNAPSIAVRATSSFMGGVAMSGIQALGQQRKCFEHKGRSLPTHVPLEAPAEGLGTRLGKVWNKGLTSLDLRKNKARDAYLSKVYSSMEGGAIYNGIAAIKTKMGADTVAATAGSVLLTGIQTVGFLGPFYANKQSLDEAKLDNTTRFASAMQNIWNPDREVLPHGTRPGTVARQFENGYNRLRGLEQVVPQAGVDITEAVRRGVMYGLTSIGSSVANQIARQSAGLSLREAPVDIEMGMGAWS